MKKQWIQSLRVGLLASVMIVGFAPTTHAASSTYGTCQAVTVAVSANESNVKDQSISGEFCTPTVWSEQSPHTVDVLIAGATYNHTYWDWPQDSQRYSYVDKTLQAGRATFTFDRLGSGKSSRLPAGGLAQTVTTDANIVHQLVSWIRGQGYTRVNGVAHSLGSITLTKEAALYNDIDKVVVTGILHSPGIGLNSLNFATSLYPVPLDPLFVGQGYDATYLTTLPGRRASVFYDTQTADPAVTAYDESHKDVVTTGELTSSILELQTLPLLNSTQNITEPVLLVMGQDDNIFCNLTVNCSSDSDIKANEQPYYSHASKFEVAHIPDTGHNLTLHPSADLSFQAINTWLNT